MSLEIEIYTEAKVAKRIQLTGVLDTDTAPILQARIDQEIKPENSVVILDLANLEFLSSAGVQVIFKLKKTVAANTGEFFLVNIKPHIQKVFDIIKALDKLNLGIFNSIEEMDEYLAAMQNKVKG